MVVQRLTTGSIRVSQNMMRALAPGGKAFNDLRPPMPQEIAQAGSALFGMFPKGKRLLSTIHVNIVPTKSLPHSLFFPFECRVFVRALFIFHDFRLV